MLYSHDYISVKYVPGSIPHLTLNHDLQVYVMMLFHAKFLYTQ